MRNKEESERGKKGSEEITYSKKKWWEKNKYVFKSEEMNKNSQQCVMKKLQCYNKRKLNIEEQEQTAFTNIL